MEVSSVLSTSVQVFFKKKITQNNVYEFSPHCCVLWEIFILIVLLIILQLITLDEQITFSLPFNC